jgi:hypothetical protein
MYLSCMVFGKGAVYTGYGEIGCAHANVRIEKMDESVWKEEVSDV